MKMMATRLRALVASSCCAAARTSPRSTGVRIVPSASVRSLTSSRMSRSAIGDEIAPQAPGAAAVAPAHLQHVAEAARGDDADLRAAPLQQRVGADGGAVHDRADAGGAAERRSPLRKPCASSPRRDGTFAVRNVRAAASSRNRSVNVPPTSTPTMTPRVMRRARLRVARVEQPSSRSTTCSRGAPPRARHSRAARRARRAPDRASAGSPKPPPPGVSSRTFWPRRILTSVTLETSGGVASPASVS